MKITEIVTAELPKLKEVERAISKGEKFVPKDEEKNNQAERKIFSDSFENINRKLVSKDGLY